MGQEISQGSFHSPSRPSFSFFHPPKHLFQDIIQQSHHTLFSAGLKITDLPNGLPLPCSSLKLCLRASDKDVLLPPMPAITCYDIISVTKPSRTCNLMMKI